MIGAIIGDMAGSRFERHPPRAGIDPLGFPLFTGESRFTEPPPASPTTRS